MISRRQFVFGTALAPLSCSIMGKAKPRVVVVGGGFGGATAARYVKRLAPAATVLLVEPTRSFITCPFSNLVLAGKRELESISFNYSGLQAEGIKRIPSAATHVDVESRRVGLEANNALLSWDYLVLSPGIQLRYDDIEGTGGLTASRLPHAWKAGYQTLRLRRQLEGMKKGGLFLISAPADPYRCPPGPYERASLVAEYFKQHNPSASIIVLDAKENFTKKDLFLEGWQARYPGMIKWVNVAETGTLRRVDDKRKIFYTDFDEFKADVGNLIPPQRASRLLTEAGLDGGIGWCQVDPRTFESVMAKNIYVLGDAVNATPMPKSAFSANNQAKICAASIAARITGKPMPETFMMNTCYSLVAEDYGISISGTYRVREGELVSVPNSGGQSPLNAGAEVHRAEAAHTFDWYRAITRDSFG